MEPEVWFRSWKYLCASCIKLKHCALATPPGSETEFEVIPPPACHVWIGPTLMTNYRLSERAPKSTVTSAQRDLASQLRTEDSTAFFLLSFFRPGGAVWRHWEWGHFKHSLSRCGEVARGREGMHPPPCKEVVQHPTNKDSGQRCISGPFRFLGQIIDP